MSGLARSLIACLVCTTLVPAQSAPQRLDAVDHAERMARIALTGDLGLAPLLPVLADSPRDLMYFADRLPVEQGAASVSDGGPPTMVDGFLPAGPDGTGTDKSEIFKYQIPGGYVPGGARVPLVVCYHGFGSSAGSVALQTTLDEEANTRGWFYMSPTGIDDQLFGSPISQQNTEAAIQFMLDNFDIDADRIYMVGFSMGGGVVANFTARRRDPDGIMIAALGIVSGSYDWTMSWVIGTGPIKTLLQNPYNFGGTPAQFPYAYQRSSDLYFVDGTYPPLPGALDATRSMARNLGSTPTYVTWDLGDTLPEILAQQPVFAGQLTVLGGTVVVKPITGTPAPTHSWTVLNEVDLFNFFDGKVVNRTPASFDALLDGSKRVSWSGVTQMAAGDFSRVTGVAVPATRTMTAQGVQNTSELLAQVDLAGITGPANVHVSATGADGNDCDLQINDLAAPPAWLQDPSTGALLPGTESDPVEEGLITGVPAFGSVSVDLVTNSEYIANLSTSPEPAQIGNTVTLDIEAPHAATAAYLLIGFNQQLSTFKGSHKLLVQLGPTTLVIAVPLIGGTVSLQGDVPNDPALSGIEILMQGIMASGPGINSMTNLWRMDIG